jgi:hypothetical protein
MDCKSRERKREDAQEVCAQEAPPSEQDAKERFAMRKLSGSLESV